MRESRAEYQRAWRKANPEKVREQDRRYRERHPERVKQFAKKRNRERYWSLRRFLDSVQLTCGCVDCGYVAHVDALQFDHVGKKKWKVGQCFSMRSAVAEMEKCEVRCANCHAIVTQQRRENENPGT